MDKEEYTVNYRMEEGDLVSFNNRRVFHGRGSFGSNDTRHLQGTYTDTDEFVNRLRTLKKKFGEPFVFKKIGNFDH